MDELLYQMIFKRKSFHRFKGKKQLSGDKLREIEEQMSKLIPLVNEIQVEWKIVRKNETSCKRGEYCILAYSEKKEGYLCNIGYMLEQIDLWLASKNIGACWYGMGKSADAMYKGLDFVIMIAIEKADADEFRKDYTKAKRKETEDVWHGESNISVASVAKYAPSACNTQPWLVETNGETINIYRVRGKRGIMPASSVEHYNKIDIGIFLLFIELCLKHENITYKRQITLDDSSGDKIHVATYIVGSK